VLPKENELLEDFEKDGLMLENFNGDETSYWEKSFTLMVT
jgi:hypothetical protein